MQAEHKDNITFLTQGGFEVAHFRAMANPCVIFIEHKDSIVARSIMKKVAEEAWRIEKKYSRYLATSIISQINTAEGQSIHIDEETYHLLTLADVLWQESNGVFDITSGAFRQIWDFNKSQAKIPNAQQVNEALKQIGWKKVIFNQQQITLPANMQIDFGGIGKEYAADCCANIASTLLDTGILVNLGGDIAIKGKRSDDSPWQIGIESKNGNGQVWKKIQIFDGAIATSGDVYKSIFYQGKRYGHIINAKTGFPVESSPHTVTVAAPNCTEAGILSTLAMLEGKKAEVFLKDQGRPHWIQR